MKTILGIALCLLIYCPVYGQIMPKTLEIDRAKVVEKKVKTTYDKYGRPVNQGQVRKGQHQVTGSISLSSGRATVTINTSPNQGRQDVGFLSSSTYRGFSWSLDTANANTYRVIPLSGNSFMIKSSDTTDNVTVQWEVKGD